VGRHHDIQNKDIVGIVLGKPQRFVAIVRVVHCVSFRFERLLDMLSNFLIVIGHKDSHVIHFALEKRAFHLQIAASALRNHLLIFLRFFISIIPSMDLWLPPHDFRVRSLRKLGYSFASTPFGDCMALATESHLVALRFVENRFEALADLQSRWPKVKLSPSSDAAHFLKQSFEHPEKIQVMAVGTPFQLTIWEFLRSIPPGTTMTYGEVAAAIARPLASRAVGQAVGANEIAVVIPCHRVVSRGKLTGYRWGLERKRQLLAGELSVRQLLG